MFSSRTKTSRCFHHYNGVETSCAHQASGRMSDPASATVVRVFGSRQSLFRDFQFVCPSPRPSLLLDTSWSAFHRRSLQTSLVVCLHQHCHRHCFERPWREEPRSSKVRYCLETHSERFGRHPRSHHVQPHHHVDTGADIACLVLSWHPQPAAVVHVCRNSCTHGSCYRST